jgi:hypothetical protein
MQQIIPIIIIIIIIIESSPQKKWNSSIPTSRVFYPFRAPSLTDFFIFSLGGERVANKRRRLAKPYMLH